MYSEHAASAGISTPLNTMAMHVSGCRTALVVLILALQQLDLRAIVALGNTPPTQDAAGTHLTYLRDMMLANLTCTASTPDEQSARCFLPAQLREHYGDALSPAMGAALMHNFETQRRHFERAHTIVQSDEGSLDPVGAALQQELDLQRQLLREGVLATFGKRNSSSTRRRRVISSRSDIKLPPGWAM